MNYKTKFGEVMQFIYFRNGIKSEMLARCQFGMRDGKCGASLIYPLPNHSWRHSIGRSYNIDLPLETQISMIGEVVKISEDYPNECLNIDALYADTSEAANSITRDRKTHKSCHQILLLKENNEVMVNCHLFEDSIILKQSLFYNTITKAIEPYETIAEQLPKRQARKLP